MKVIQLDGTAATSRREIKKILDAQVELEDWFDGKANEFVDRVSGFRNIPHFKALNEEKATYCIEITNTEEFMLRRGSLFRWLMRKVMRINRVHKEKQEVDTGLIMIKMY